MTDEEIREADAADWRAAADSEAAYYLDLGPWQRAEAIDWSPLPPRGSGKLPAEWVH